LRYAVGHLALVFGLAAALLGVCTYIVGLLRGLDYWSAWIASRDVAAIFFCLLFFVGLPVVLYRMRKANKRLGVTFTDLDRMSKAELDAFHVKTKSVFND
jgi:hypothetical protein